HALHPGGGGGARRWPVAGPHQQRDRDRGRGPSRIDGRMARPVHRRRHGAFAATIPRPMTATPDLARLGGDIERGLAAAGAAAGAAAVVLGDRPRALMHGDAVPGEPVVPWTLFHICSCSKTSTAAVFARLVRDGSAAWDERACSVVPEFEFSDPRATAECTFRDLASMRVGLGREGIAEGGIDQLLPREERLARARHMPFVAPFRERFRYSNLCYIALALAAERLGGRPYQDLVRDLVCTPLGLGDSSSAGFGTGVDALAALPSLEVGGKP